MSVKLKVTRTYALTLRGPASAEQRAELQSTHTAKVSILALFSLSEASKMEDDERPLPVTTARRYSAPPLSNGSHRSVDDLIEETIVAHDEQQRKITRQYQALGAVLLVVAAVASLGVAFIALATNETKLDGEDVEHSSHYNVSSPAWDTDIGSSTLDDSEGDKNNNDDLNVEKQFSALQQTQIQNYKSDKALIINVHITHHAGTTFCSEMKKWGPTPEFACLGGDNWHNKADLYWPRGERPWNATNTIPRVDLVRKHFHMISWEFGKIPNPPLEETNWEYENLLSVYITRNPLDRLLSGGGTANRKFGTAKEGRNIKQWRAYANSTFTDNFALNRLTGGTCVNGEETPESCLEKGKELLNRFTIILDQECLSESMSALAELLDKPEPDPTQSKVYRKVPNSAASSAQQRIHHDDVYKYLLKRNKQDIALYEWSKSKSLVQCDMLGGDESEG